ncbi:MAG: hypothetical protein O9256_01950 [Rhizobiaceae bacterium]|nr:hypothetical protein [Rhizobiaceae bacterium]MCZ8349845.1 hypothetical protein [Rhizobium sp.]
MIDVRALPTADLADLVAIASAELDRRRAGAPAPPVQLGLLPGFDPVDPASVDLSERLPDGSRRWIVPKEAHAITGFSAKTWLRRIEEEGIGVKIGGRYYIDAKRIMGRM